MGFWKFFGGADSRETAAAAPVREYDPQSTTCDNFPLADELTTTKGGGFRFLKEGELPPALSKPAVLSAVTSEENYATSSGFPALPTSPAVDKEPHVFPGGWTKDSLKSPDFQYGPSSHMTPKVPHIEPGAGERYVRRADGSLMVLPSTELAPASSTAAPTSTRRDQPGRHRADRSAAVDGRRRSTAATPAAVTPAALAPPPPRPPFQAPIKPLTPAPELVGVGIGANNAAGAAL